jgi:hypothetical protein
VVFQIRTFTRKYATKSTPQELRKLVKKTAPPEAEIITLPWAYEDEDYTIAVVVPDTVDRMSARQLRERLIDTIMDYEDAHDTFTVCMVWREREKTFADIHT